jgi:penicillin-binding protein 2
MSREEQQRANPLGYEAGDTVGATGIERAWESYLRGQRGWEKRVVDARGRYRSGPAAEDLVDPPPRLDPIPGRDLRLSIDADLEQAIDRAMRPHAAGAVVVVDVRTGRLLALYSKPDFDSNDLSGGAGHARVREAFTRLYADPLRPMLDKTMSGAFQPGSTMKPFSALAALEDHVVDPDHTEKCEGYVVFGRRIFRCSHVHGTVKLKDAIARSCNVYFFHLAEAVGMDRIARVAQAFGLGEKTGLGINPESPGRIPTRSWYALRYRGAFRVGFTLNMAIGEGDVTVTPLQLAMAYAAIANGGTLYQPQVVRSVETSDGAVVQEFPPRVRRQVPVAPDDLRRVTDALFDVVNDPNGTAYPARDPALDVAGKTGTAQTGYVAKKAEDPKLEWFLSQNHAWFSSFAPTHAPEVAVTVLVEHGGSGPEVAVPVAMQIIHEYERLQAVRLGRPMPAKMPIATKPKAGAKP